MAKKGIVTKRVLGLTGKEQEIVVTNTTYCSLCSHQLTAGDKALLLSGETVDFYVHANCAIAKLTKIHNREFRQNVKNRPIPSRTKKKKKEHFSDGTIYCAWCRLSITAGNVFYRDKKAFLHPACHRRRKQAVDRLN